MLENDNSCVTLEYDSKVCGEEYKSFIQYRSELADEMFIIWHCDVEQQEKASATTVIPCYHHASYWAWFIESDSVWERILAVGLYIMQNHPFSKNNNDTLIHPEGVKAI